MKIVAFVSCLLAAPSLAGAATCDTLAASLKLTGTEEYSLTGAATLKPRGEVQVRAKAADGTVREFTAIARVDTPEELVAYRHGGILPYVVRQLVARS